MTDEQITEQLAEALAAQEGRLYMPPVLIPHYADRLLPVVRRAQAQALRDAADGIGEWPGVGNAIRSFLRDRADALEAEQ